jgi:hypothetical protein
MEIPNLPEKLKQNRSKSESRHKFNNCFVELISFLLFEKLILFRRFPPNVTTFLEIKFCQERFVPLWRWVHEKHKYFIKILGQKILEERKRFEDLRRGEKSD